MQTALSPRFASALVLATLFLPFVAPAELILGEPPQAPKDVSGLSGGVGAKFSVTGGFSVNTDSREQVRVFYNSVYRASDGVPMDTTANVASCTAGTNSTAFQQAVLRRINWFRAMAGVPAAVTLSAANSARNQQGAVMMSANNTLNHFPPSSWTCYSSDGANAASNSNLAIGSAGADAITGYIWDFGSNNYEVGHRRWLLYPQTQVMGTGDVPVSGSYNSANTTWVFDANLFGPRPATRQPYVAWPPKGYVPYQVVYPQWSLALSNADFSVSSVSMTSNGLSVAVATQTYVSGYGENTLAWVPMGLDWTSASTTFPFNGTDTVYSVTVQNIKVGSTYFSLSYNVTVFDPAVPGPDYVAPTISGPSQPMANTANQYSCQPVNNPNVSSYQWRVSQRASGNLTDNAQNGLTNFTIATVPPYPVITNAFDGSGKCFHLVHGDASNIKPQLLQLNRLLFPASNTVVSFKSALGYATTDESARVQVSVDGGANWRDLFVETGIDGRVESSFVPRTLSLSNYAAQATLLRFNFDIGGQGYYYVGGDSYIGWCLENIVVTNTEQLVNLVTNSTVSTNFTFTPAQTGNFNLEAQGMIFTEFPIGWGPVKPVTVVAPVVMSAPWLTNNQVRLDFAATPGAGATFKLLQTDQLGTGWTTNTSATLTTNIPGSSYRFTTPSGAGTRFYRVLQTGGS